MTSKDNPDSSGRDNEFTRRQFIAAAATTVPVAGFPIAFSARANSTVEVSLKAASGRVRLLPEPSSETDVWCYNGSVSGTKIRVKKGNRTRVRFYNGLGEETIIHWHGVRVPNAMDGVPHLIQIPVSPGTDFLYEFDAIDTGTYWYHPPQRGFEQVGRGLYGALIIQEPNPVRVDRDLTWIFDDWRLMKSAVMFPWTRKQVTDGTSRYQRYYPVRHASGIAGDERDQNQAVHRLFGEWQQSSSLRR